MGPPIQYANTNDGVSIAYWTLGEGPSLVWASLPNSHVEFEWRLPDLRRTYELASSVGTFVRYDHRGFGLSNRDITDFSIDALELDLEAVVEQLEHTKIRLVSTGFAVPIAVRFAARHQERLSHLVIWGGSAAGKDMANASFESIYTLAEKDWTMASESYVHAVEGWSRHERASERAAWLRESVAAPMFVSFMREAKDWDARGFLTQIEVPTLILQPQGRQYLSIEAGRNMAAATPSSRLVLYDGSASGTSPDALSALASFLFDGAQVEPKPASASATTKTGMTAILFADIVDSTGLTEELGDSAFRERARELDGALRTIIRDHGGTPVEGKLLGDGVLATFTSARQAIVTALACGRAGEDGGLPLHLGLHAGDVIREEGNVFGGAVNIAARIAGESAAGEVLVSQTVRELARTSAGVTFEDKGERTLKGVGEAVRVWAVSEGAS